jgi:hypothetical protein
LLFVSLCVSVRRFSWASLIRTSMSWNVCQSLTGNLNNDDTTWYRIFLDVRSQLSLGIVSNQSIIFYWLFSLSFLLAWCRAKLFFIKSSRILILHVCSLRREMDVPYPSFWYLIFEYFYCEYSRQILERTVTDNTIIMLNICSLLLYL